MNSIGILSNSSAYTKSAFSVYGSTRASSLTSEQEISAGNNSETKSAPIDDLKDKAIISDEALALAKNELLTAKVEQEIKYKKVSKDENQNAKIAQNTSEKLTPEQQQQVAKLQAADSEVKAHEQAHLTAGGINASAPTFKYQKGPDGQNYAVAGEVQIKFSGSNNPDKTISNAETMKSAALAPGNPSSQDMKVAQKADQIITEAKQEKNKDAEMESQN